MNARDAILEIAILRVAIGIDTRRIEDIKTECSHVYADGTSAIGRAIVQPLYPDPEPDASVVQECKACGKVTP